MRVLILGATGLLGHTLYRRWRARPGWEVFGTWHSAPLPGLEPLELLEPGAAARLIARLGPQAVAIPASDPHVDRCEREPEATRRLNVDAVLEAAAAARAAGARVVFFSTDYVFDGRRGGYTEEDAPVPPCEYGRQKLAAERALLERGGALVLRVSGLYGWELRPRNFVLQVLAKLRRGEPARAVTDQRYCPGFVEDLVPAAAELIARGAEGVFHLTGSESVDRLGFARAIARAFGLDAELARPALTAEFAAPGAAPRPADSSLDCGKLARLLGRPLRGPSAALPDMARREAEWLDYIRTSR